MLSRVKHLWRHHKLLLLAFSLAAALTLLFAVRMVAFSLYWADPEHQYQPLEGWMTLRYVAHSYQLNPKDVDRILQIDAAPDGRQTLQRLMQQKNMTLHDLQLRLDEFIASRPPE